MNTDDANEAARLLEIPEGTQAPEVSMLSVWILLRHQTRTATGPDEIPYLPPGVTMLIFWPL